MKSSVNLLAVVLILLVASCKKEKEPVYDPAAALAAKVKSVTHSNAGTTDSYTYDSNGRIQLIENSNGYRTSFEYRDSVLAKTETDKSGSTITATQFTLDARGLVSSAVVMDGNGNIEAYHTYTFDEQKQMTAQLNYNANHEINGKQEWVWGGGNMYNYAVYDSTLSHKVFDSYSWYHEPAITSVGNANTGQQFLGADSKFLVRKMVGYVWGAANTLSTFEYTFDNQHRINEIKTYDYNGTLKNIDTYTYY